MNYNGAGTIKSLADLGIELDASGKMSFNQTTTDPSRHIAFSSLSNAQIAAAFSFLGSATTGFGRLSSQLNQISDPITGLIRVQQDQQRSSFAAFGASSTGLQQQVGRQQFWSISEFPGTTRRWGPTERVGTRHRAAVRPQSRRLKAS